MKTFGFNSCCTSLSLCMCPDDNNLCLVSSLVDTWRPLHRWFQSKVPAEWLTSEWQTQTVGEYKLPGQVLQGQRVIGSPGDKATVSVAADYHLCLPMFLIYVCAHVFLLHILLFRCRAVPSCGSADHSLHNRRPTTGRGAGDQCCSFGWPACWRGGHTVTPTYSA